MSIGLLAFGFWLSIFLFCISISADCFRWVTWSFDQNVAHLWCAHYIVTVCDEVNTVEMSQLINQNWNTQINPFLTRADKMSYFLHILHEWMNICRVNWVAFSTCETIESSHAKWLMIILCVQCTKHITQRNANWHNDRLFGNIFVLAAAAATAAVVVVIVVEPQQKALRPLFNWAISISCVLLQLICKHKRES